jgi:uncharacterized CHY-type Zn-finger protein
MRIHGQTIDEQTRCVHYGAAEDVIAIKFPCCDRYYPCHLCHAEDADHPAEQWPFAERDTLAVVCGVCSTDLTISRYLDVEACPSCGAPFNPGCKLHTHLYFQTA